MAIDPLTIVMVVILAALVFFMFRNSRKRQREQEETRSKMVPGAAVMTNFGLYGTLLSVDEDDNSALIETSPGHILKVHRQVLARVVEPTTSEIIADSDRPEQGEDIALPLDSSQPEYGERIHDASKKPGAKNED